MLDYESGSLIGRSFKLNSFQSFWKNEDFQSLLLFLLLSKETALRWLYLHYIFKYQSLVFSIFGEVFYSTSKEKKIQYVFKYKSSATMYNHLCHYLADEPEIDVEAEKVHSGVGKEAHLTCIVHGEPRPSVSTSASHRCILIKFCLPTNTKVFSRSFWV